MNTSLTHDYLWNKFDLCASSKQRFNNALMLDCTNFVHHSLIRC